MAKRSLCAHLVVLGLILVLLVLVFVLLVVILVLLVVVLGWLSTDLSGGACSSCGGCSCGVLAASQDHHAAADCQEQQRALGKRHADGLKARPWCSRTTSTVGVLVQHTEVSKQGD